MGLMFKTDVSVIVLENLTRGIYMLKIEPLLNLIS